MTEPSEPSKAALPQAVASGPAAATPDAVNPLRVAIGAGLLAALYLLVLYLATPVPMRVLATFGGANNDVERHGGLEMVWTPPQGMSDQEIIARFRTGDDRAQVRRDGANFVIQVPRIRREEVEGVAQFLGGGYGLEFHRVLRVDAMKELFSRVGSPRDGGESLPVTGDVDQWRPDVGGGLRIDYYLTGTSAEAIDAKIAEAEQDGWHLPDGTSIAWEQYTTQRGSVRWRTYVIDNRAEIDGADIANAMTSYDPNTNRPIVLIDFTREGAEKFARLTEEIVGEKLATMIGNTVYSAPIINDTIRGGRASVTMGGSDPRQQDREAQLLVNTLRAGALPKGGTLVSSRYVAPKADALKEWLSRAAIAVLGGLLFGVFAWIVVRVTRPVRRRGPARTAAPLPASRIFVTLLAPVSLFVVTRVFALGINHEELENVVNGEFSSWFSWSAAVESFSFGALGITPVISAFMFVEVLAVIFPGWRRRRHAGPDARAPLTSAVVITAASLLFLQAWFITHYLHGFDRAGVEVLAPGLGPRMLVITSFALGTLMLVGVAALIRDHGLGNGYGVLTASGFLLAAWDRIERIDIDGSVIVGGMTFAVIAIAVCTVLRWRIARLGEAPLRVPTSGHSPVGEVGGLMILVTSLATLLGDLTSRFYAWATALREHYLIPIAAMVLLTMLWSFAFARPNVTRKLAERVGLVAPARVTWWQATGLSAAVLVVLAAVATVTVIVEPNAAWLADVMLATLVASVALDIYDDARGRRVTLDRVWTLHQAQYVDLVGKALTDAAIPHHFASANLKTLLAFFGPFAGVDVLVPPEHAPAARQRLRELFGSA